jgi:hypothetical protein
LVVTELNDTTCVEKLKRLQSTSRKFKTGDRELDVVFVLTYIHFLSCPSTFRGEIAYSLLNTLALMGQNQRIGIKIEANANLYVVGIATY